MVITVASYHASSLLSNTYLDVTVGDVLTVCILETLKDGLEDMPDLLLAHVDPVGVRVEIRLS